MIVLRVAGFNIRGVNDVGKREEVGTMCRERNIDILALTETKLKGRGEKKFGDFTGMYSGVNERVRAREGVAILMKDEW